MRALEKDPVTPFGMSPERVRLAEKSPWSPGKEVSLFIFCCYS
jgi:hypothetical protein